MRLASSGLAITKTYADDTFMCYFQHNSYLE